MAYALGASAQYVAVGAASAKFATAMVPGQLYRFSSSTNCWVKIAVTGGAAAADTANNHYCHAGASLILKNPEVSEADESFVHVIRDTADGDATLSPIGPG
jgi:hypothetical protein